MLRSFRAGMMALGLCSVSLLAQETRGSITGKVTDPQGAVIPGAAMAVTNIDTNLTQRTKTNQTGYYEVNLLVAGKYTVTAEATGFKKSVRSGVDLDVGGRMDLPFQLQIGQIAETVEVTAEAALLDTTSATSGRVIENRQIMQLPFSDLNPFVLAGLAPGMQWVGRPDYRRPFDNGGTSDFRSMGDAGRNEYTIDGASNMRGSDVAYVPPADAVQEFKLEMTPFDASYGHTAGATINVMTKAGTNTFHGSLYDQHWQTRWNATQHFKRIAWEEQVRQGKLKPDSQKNNPGRQNYYGAGIGGPVWIPKVFDGRNRLFFYFMYSGIMKDENEPGSDTNRTVPKMAWRTGDFSDMLALDATKYTIYDPRSARKSGSRVVRTPFPGNTGIPILNPLYKFYEPIYPKPNNIPGLVSPEGFNNYFAAGMPKNERFKSAINRVDYNINERHRVYGRWHFNRRIGDEYDWAYETMRGLQSNGITRVNYGGGADYVWTVSDRTILNAGVSLSQYQDGEGASAVSQIQNKYKPSDVGLPAYLDTKAGEFHRVPGLDFNNITDIDNGYRMIGNLATTGQARVSLSTIKGNHSLKAGWDERRYWNARRGPGNSSGGFTFRNNFMRASDNDNVSSNHALDWATFMMGLPTGIAIDTNDSYYYSTRYRGLYLQDDWRLTDKLRLNLGLRYEREAGTTERFNRGISGGWDFNEKFIFSDMVEAAYLRNPIPEVSALKVRGTGSYLGAKYPNYTDGTHHLLPKIGAVYQINNKTVIRGGYAWFYDTFSTFNNRPRTDGFSQGTGTTLSSDLGLTFCCGVGDVANLSSGRTIFADPFPVRADGTRFDVPYGNRLGAIILAGRGVTLPPRNYQPSFQQRWRIGIQRELTKNMMVDVSYNAAFAKIPVHQRIDFLPQQYWATGNTRRQDIDDALNANLPNPFNISNLASLRTSDPLIYNYLSTQGFFTGTTIRRHQLLRQYPNLNSSNGLRPGISNPVDVYGGNKYYDIQVQFERRFTNGFQSSVFYTFSHGEEQDYYYNEFDAKPMVYRPQDALRPHRIVWASVFEVPFGKGRKWVTSGPMQHVIGGWQLSWIYQFQTGQATDWGNRFFYGDMNKIGDLFNHEEVNSKDIHVWFDPKITYTGSGAVPSGFVGFEGRSSMQPGSFHVRMFPTRLDALRTDGLRTWDVKILRKFKIHERLAFSFAVDLLNATNHTNFGGPQTDPTNRDFGRVTSTNGYARVIQLNGRIEW
ncbi:MAG: TonB-dependent receptor [Acidobacteria bacterium]|nr:TonB-dependent receptor [Acidobacteriota bacterium]